MFKKWSHKLAQQGRTLTPCSQDTIFRASFSIFKMRQSFCSSQADPKQVSVLCDGWWLYIQPLSLLSADNLLLITEQDLLTGEGHVGRAVSLHESLE